MRKPSSPDSYPVVSLLLYTRLIYHTLNVADCGHSRQEMQGYYRYAENRGPIFVVRDVGSRSGYVRYVHTVRQSWEGI